jgi:hypothetical protein
MVKTLLSLFALALFVAVALFIFGSPVYAQDGTAVTLPIGDWVQQAKDFIAPFILAVIAWLMRKLPAHIVDILKTMKAEQLLAKAVDYGLNAVAGAAKDKVLSVSVGNAVIAQAVQYAIDNGPGWLIKWLGGEEAIAAKIIARLNLDANAAVYSDFGGAPRLIGKAG